MRCGCRYGCAPPWWPLRKSSCSARKPERPRAHRKALLRRPRTARPSGRRVIAASVLAAAGTNPATTGCPEAAADCRPPQPRTSSEARPNSGLSTEACHRCRGSCRTQADDTEVVPPALITSGFHGSGGSGSVPTGFRRGFCKSLCNLRLPDLGRVSMGFSGK